MGRSRVSPPAYLAEDTPKIMRAQRRDEQVGKRQIARVHAQDHEQDDHALTQGSGPDEEVSLDLAQHPLLLSQYLDGAENRKLDRRAKVALENAKREQQLENQLKLGLAPGMSRHKTPTPGSSFGA
jgi:hypothetical protein